MSRLVHGTCFGGSRWYEKELRKLCLSQAVGSVDPHATENLEHLKEENALLQAQVDQVTASLMETQGAKQEAEQKLQSVKQVMLSD